jgi:hypothetical protein
MNQTTITKEKLELAVADGTMMSAYVAYPRAHHGDERAAYEPSSARQAWALTLEFLRS